MIPRGPETARLLLNWAAEDPAVERETAHRADAAAASIAPVRDQDLARARGRLRIAFAASADGATRLAELAQAAPCRAFLPADEGPRSGGTEREPVAVCLNTAGGVCGDDRLEVRVEVRERACATVTTQAAERIYRAISAPARLRTTLVVGRDARLHWAPQETILFDSSRLWRQMEIDLAPGARLLAAETLVFGRRAMGERIGRVQLQDDWRLRLAGGRLLWADTLRISGEPPSALESAVGLAGAEALSTIIYAGVGADAARDTAREAAADCEASFGATSLHEVMVARILGTATQVRDALLRVLAALRIAALGLEPRISRVWSC